MSTVVDVSPRTRRSYSASVTQRHNGTVESHVTDGASRHGGHVTDGTSRCGGHVTDGTSRLGGHVSDGTSRHGGHVTDGASRHGGHVTDVANRLGGHVTNNGSFREPSVSLNESDEDSTAGEGDTVPHESTTTDTIPDPIDPIDFIESHPRSYTEPASSFAHRIEGKGIPLGEHHRYENWGMQMREVEDGGKRGGGSRVIKRSKGSRVSKYDRQRMPYLLPKPGKVKAQHARPSPLARKRRLSGRVLRAPLSNASEGDMAQADEMGEGEGKDDGFVDCPEGMKKRGKKRQGGVHVILPNMASGSPPSSPSNTPVSSRRRMSSRKSRPKPRPRKPVKPTLASADISTQETTTPGPGSSDTTDENVSNDETHPHNVGDEGAVMVAADEGGYEDLRNRSVTPNFHYPSSGGGEESNGTFECDKESEEQQQQYVSSNGMIAADPGSPGVRGQNQPSIPTIYSARDNLHSNSEENLRFDSNETSDTDLIPFSHRSSPPRGARHAWSSRRLESDLSTAPFSSETSDMDTSGNEKIHTDGGSMSDLTCSKSDQLELNLSPSTSNIPAANHPDYIPAATHSNNIPAITHSISNQHVASGGSSGDEVKRKKEANPPLKPPLKPPVSRKPASIITGSGPSRISPPNPKKPLCLSTSSPGQNTKEKERNSQRSPESSNAPRRSKSTMHPPPVVKPKPPLMTKPSKPVLRPKPAHLSNQDLPLKGKHLLMLQPSVESNPTKREVAGDASGSCYKFTSTQSEMTLRTAHVESDDRRSERLKKVQSEPSLGALKKAPRSPTPAARKLTKVHEEQEHEELEDPSHDHPMRSLPLTNPAILAKVKRQGLEKSLHDAKPASSSEAVEFEKMRETSTASSTDSSKSVSSSEATSGHSQSPNISPFPSPAARKKPIPHQKPSVLPKKPSLIHQSVSATSVLQTKEEGGKDPIPEPERRVNSQVMPPFSRGAVRPVLASMGTSKNPPENSLALLDQSGLNSEELPLIKQTDTPSIDEQGPPLPPKRGNRRSTHIELVIPGEDLPPEIPPRRPRISSPRRPPPSPPTPRRAGGEKRSTISQANYVRHRNNPLKSSEPKRHSMFSLNLSSSQINSISENYEVCEFEVEFAESGNDANAGPVSQQAPKKPPRFKIEGNVSGTSKSPDLLQSRTLNSPDEQSRGIGESKKGSDSEQESTSPTGVGMRFRPNRGSSKKQAPPKPPKYTSPDETSLIPRASTPGGSTPASLLRKVSDLTQSSLTSLPLQEDTPPPLPSQPIPKKKDRLGSTKKIPAVGLSSLDQLRTVSPLPVPQPPKMEDTRTGSKKTCDEPIYDVIKDVPRVDPYNVVSLASEGTKERESSPKLPPRNVTKAGSFDDEKELPRFGTHIKSNSVSLMFRRATSDRFKHKVSTMDPEVAETLSKEVFQRTPSLDRLNDRMDRSTKSSMHLMSDSSSDDEDEASVVSPVLNGLPKPPMPAFYNPDQSLKSKLERLGKSVSVFVSSDDEPLYQYINTAEFLTSSALREREIKSPERNQLEIARQLSQRKLWCELPEVIKSGILNDLNEEEKKLQEAMFEVITSEATYLRSLDVLIEHFVEDPGMNPGLPEGRRVLDKRQHHVIFSNVREVRDTSARFLDELQKRQRESAVVKNISDIILQYSEHCFDCYVHYCTNQVYQSRELQDCLENNIMFREYLKRLESHKRCQNLSMQSFLLLPMQRITRLPLLILAILNRTPLDHPDHELVERTLRTVQKLVTLCNDGARKMERTEQLHAIHQKLDFGKLKPFPLVSVSRQLERKGTLLRLRVEQKLFGKQRVKRTPYYLFVFTDYIIITKKKKDPKGDYTYQVVDHSSRALVEVEDIESHPGVTFPKHVFGEQETVAMATWAVSTANVKHAFLVILLDNAHRKSEKYIFVAQNDTDKTRWMESITRPDMQKEEEKIYQHWDCPQVQAVYDYHAQQPDELELERGDVVKVYRKMADGWYEGERLRDLQWGWFPSNFTVEVENEHTRARNLRETHRLLSLPFSPEEFSARMQNIS